MAPQRIREKRHGAPGPLLHWGSAADPTLPLLEPSPCLGLPQHPDEHRPERPVLLAVDKDARPRRAGSPCGAGSLLAAGCVSSSSARARNRLYVPGPHLLPPVLGLGYPLVQHLNENGARRRIFLGRGDKGEYGPTAVTRMQLDL